MQLQSFHMFRGEQDIVPLLTICITKSWLWITLQNVCRRVNHINLVNACSWEMKKWWCVNIHDQTHGLGMAFEPRLLSRSPFLNGYSIPPVIRRYREFGFKSSLRLKNSFWWFELDKCLTYTQGRTFITLMRNIHHFKSWTVHHRVRSFQHMSPNFWTALILSTSAYVI